MFRFLRKNILRILFATTFLLGFGFDYFQKNINNNPLEVKKNETENSSEESELDESDFEKKLYFQLLAITHQYQLVAKLSSINLERVKSTQSQVNVGFKIFLKYIRLVLYN